MNFTTEKPDYACVFVSKHGKEYGLWCFVWELAEPPKNADEDEIYFYLAWTDNDGNEYDDIDECGFDEYLVLEKLPTMDERFKEEVKRRAGRF